MHRHPRSRGSEFERHGTADAPGAACDQGGAAYEIDLHGGVAHGAGPRAARGSR